MIYVLNTILIVIYNGILNLIPQISRKAKNKIFLTLSSLQMTLIVGLRDISVGKDTRQFYNFFVRISNYRNLADYDFKITEPLYMLLNYFVGKTTGSFLLLNILVAGFTVLFFSLAVYKLSKNVFWSVYIFISTCFFYQMMNQNRQVLAMSITLYAFTFLVEEKRKKYIITIVLAALIHKSALIMLILLPFSKKHYSKRMVGEYVFITVIMILFSDIVVRIIMLTPYRTYLGSSFDKHFELSAILNLIVRTCMFAFVGFFYSIYEKKRKFNIDLLYHMITWNLIFQILTVKFMLIGRITSYFFYGHFLVIPNIIETCFEKKTNKDIVKYSLFIVFLIYHIVYYTFTKTSNGVSNYRFL